MRVKFKKGSQREFLDLVISNTHCPSLRSLISRGFDIPYSTLKSYYLEERTLPEELFNNFCIFANISKEKLSFEILGDNWGRVLGGKN